MLRTLVSNDIKRQTRLLNDNERVELMECNYSFDWNVPTVNWAEYRIVYSTFCLNDIYMHIYIGTSSYLTTFSYFDWMVLLLLNRCNNYWDVINI